jgi:anti-anti-sigma factor
MGFEVKFIDEGDARKACVEGEMSIYNANALKDAFVDVASSGKAVELDLSAVSAFDTSGLQLVLSAKASCEKSGGTLRLSAASEPVETVLALFDLKYCLV